MTKNRSFTIIELLIVISIIIVFSALSLSAFNTFTEKKRLENSVSKLTSVLELAAKKTHSGDTHFCPQGGLITPYLENVTVDIVNESTFRMQPFCIGTTPTPISYSLENTVFFPTPTNRISFSRVYSERGSGQQCILIKSRTLNECSYVSINSVGVINSGDCTFCDGCMCP